LNFSKGDFPEMDRLFGTDGIRGNAGEFPLDFTSVCTLGKALVFLLKEENLDPRILIGRDTRESGDWLMEALIQGILQASGEAVTLGIIPTSAVSYLTAKHAFAAGIVISASHNPYQDNGIKIFASDGKKISESWEARLEQSLRTSPRSQTRETLNIHPAEELVEEYNNFLKSQFAGIRPLKPFKIVLDCANGSSYRSAPEVFKSLGFDVISISACPDGKNINKECGSLFPDQLSRAVLEHNANLGVAFDGDADRALWVDEKGSVLNGDHTLYVCAKHMKDKGRLKSDWIVGTVMSNMGLEKALENFQLKFYRTQVGDKYVLDQMIKFGANLGGEQSGHTIFLDDCPTGDGILTSLKMCEAMLTSDTPLSQLVAEYKEFPQILLNINVSKKEDFSLYPEIGETIESIQTGLGNQGRINVRYSGTEPLARIMIEGKDGDRIETDAQNLAAVLLKYLK
jgi:phosphoglucosamine mutase